MIETLEQILLELCLASHKVLLGVLYKPPKVDDIAKLDDILQQYTATYSEVIITGDFNEDLITRSSKTLRYVSVVEGVSLRLVSSEPTHFSPTTSTALDHFMTSSYEKVTRFSQISLPGISMHDLIFLSYRCDLKFTTKPPRLTRRIHKVNVRSLLATAMLKLFEARAKFTNKS